MVDIGATLARRFTLLSTEPVDIPGLDRFLAHDVRLRRDVRVDVITSLAPSSVRQAAGAAARVRDPRLLRVLASGRERIDEESWTYVVTDRIEGTLLSDLLSERLVTPRIAGAIIGDAARALGKALAEDVHHGYLRASAIAVANSGRITIAGLGVDGELALQAGIGRGSDEMSDATALAKIYLAAITGMDADAVTERNLPDGLGTRARALSKHVIDGTGPKKLSELLAALAPIDTRILSNFPGLVRKLPLLPAAAQANRERDKQRTLKAVGGLTVAPEATARAGHAAQEEWAEGVSDPELSASLAQVDAATGLGVVPPSETPAAPTTDPGADQAIGANDLHDLYEFDEMIEVQNLDNPPSIWEAVLQRLHRRWPKSEVLTRWLARAHKRANRSGPIRAEFILIPALVIAVIVGAIVAFSMLRTPLDSGREAPPPNTYPVFTLSPSPSVTPTATPPASPEK